MQAQLTLQQYAFASLTCITFQAYFYTNIQRTFKKNTLHVNKRCIFGALDSVSLPLANKLINISSATFPFSSRKRNILDLRI